MTRPLTYLSLTVLLLQAFPASSAVKAPPGRNGNFEYRRHWSSVRSDGTSLYDVTTIVIGTPVLASRVAVARDWKGEVWHIENSHDFDRQKITTQVVHVPSGEFLRLSYELPMTARTRIEALAEWKREYDGRKKFDEIVTLETRTVSRTAASREWDDLERTADWRSDVRTSLSTSFLDALARMQETLLIHDGDLVSVAGLVRMLSHAHSCDPSGRYSKRVEQWPDCAFDKALGKPCADKQAERVEKALRTGVMPARY